MTKEKKPRSPAPLLLRVAAGLLTAAAVVGGAGWLMRQEVKKRDKKDK